MVSSNLNCSPSLFIFSFRRPCYNYSSSPPSIHLLYLLSSDGSDFCFTENKSGNQYRTLHTMPLTILSTSNPVLLYTAAFSLAAITAITGEKQYVHCTETSYYVLRQSTNNCSILFPTWSVFTSPLNLLYQHKIIQLFLSS